MNTNTSSNFSKEKVVQVVQPFVWPDWVNEVTVGQFPATVGVIIDSDSVSVSNTPSPDTRQGTSEEPVDVTTLADGPLSVDGVPCSLWDRKPLKSGHIAVDCETEALTESHKVPRLAIVTATDGERAVVVPPADLRRFIDVHAQHHWVFHNVAFDFYVISASVNKQQRRRFLALADGGLFHDTLILAKLIDLARLDDCEGRKYDLGALSQRYLQLKVDKEDPYRTRFAELIGHDFAKPVETGFLSYAVRDTLATLRLWDTLVTEAKGIVETLKVSQDHVDEFGLLTEQIQVKSAIALERIHHRGVFVDMKAIEVIKAKLEVQLQAAFQVLDAHAANPPLFKKCADGEPLRTPSGGYQQYRKAKERHFLDAAKEIGVDEPATTSKGALNMQFKYWQYLMRKANKASPFLEAYFGLQKAEKMLGFCKSLNASRIYPRYSNLKRTGRTGCSAPNIQQIPRNDDDVQFRSAFIAPDDYLLQTIDFSGIEMVTLAAVLERQQGSSQLADVLRQGIDVHSYTAAILGGQTYEEFIQLKTGTPEQTSEFRFRRGKAKIFNFGLPGGMGIDSLIRNAQQVARIDISREEAETFRDRILTDIYPDIGRYLGEDLHALVASNLHVSRDDVERAFPAEEFALLQLRRIVAGNEESASGNPYGENVIDRFFGDLGNLNQNPSWQECIKRRDHTTLHGLFEHPHVVSPTGRVRGRVNYATYRNTQFQSLAADGTKLALWNLHRRGFRIAFYVHDEFGIYHPEDKADERCEIVERTCVEAMHSLVGDIPVKCEWTLGSCWEKP